MIAWAELAWQDYLYWQQTDKKMIKRINELIKEIQRMPFEGKGKPEPLRHQWRGYWSRRLNHEHRLVYKMDNETLFIAQCRYHY